MKIRLLTALCALWILGCDKPAVDIETEDGTNVEINGDTVKVEGEALEGKPVEVTAEGANGGTTIEVNKDGVKVEGEDNVEVTKDGVKVDTADGVKVDLKDGVKVTIPSGN